MAIFSEELITDDITYSKRRLSCVISECDQHIWSAMCNIVLYETVTYHESIILPYNENLIIVKSAGVVQSHCLNGGGFLIVKKYRFEWWSDYSNTIFTMAVLLKCPLNHTHVVVHCIHNLGKVYML